MKRTSGIFAAFVVLIASLPPTIAAHPADENPPLTLKEKQVQYQQDRFGLFIHWGIYSVLADGEWVMHDKKIPAADYERVAGFFNPTRFNAGEWVGLAKSAGARYITFTSKHHDGFAMWDTHMNDWSVTRRTPFGRDVVKELAAECQRQGLKFFLYHSQLDWHHPDYFPRGTTGQHAGRPDKGTWNQYMDFMDAQLAELLTKYGVIDGVWFDGWWDRPDADWRLERTYNLIHTLQPAALIGNNHHRKPFPGEDFQMYERDLPGENKGGFSSTSQVGNLPLETCDTINTSWGYRITDRKYKSTKDLIGYMARAAGTDANFLLNIGPMPSGEIQPEFTQRLREIGMWLAKHGESIYATRGGPLPPQPWGATTHRGRKVYVHVLDDATSSVVIPLDYARVQTARYLVDEEDVPFKDDEGTITLSLRSIRPGEYNRVVVLDTDYQPPPPPTGAAPLLPTSIAPGPATPMLELNP